MKVGSLFSGIGGIELGFEAEGYETVWFVERDEYAKTILRKYWPQATIYDDVTKIDWSTVPKVDILTGGFPCQDISNAGKRAGITGSRSSLWKYYCEAIRILRPKYALIENVAALANRGLNVVLADLAKIGYDAEWYNLSASAVGAMHRRERLFIIAYPNVQRCDDRCDNRQERYFLSNQHRNATQSESEWKGRLTRSGEIGSNVENSVGDGVTERNWNKNNQGEKSEEHSNKFERSGWWAVEPELGGTLDGFSAWLDRHMRRFYKSHKLMVAYGNAKKERTSEIMQDLRNQIGTESLQWQTRGLSSIPSEAVLLTYLRQYEANLKREELSLESEEIQEIELRSLRMEQELASPSLRPKSKKQRVDKSPDTLHALSQVLARHAETAWIDYRRKNAVNNWESGIARVANGIPNRVDRIKCLGNAVVPQCAQIFAKAIKEYEINKHDNNL